MNKIQENYLNKQERLLREVVRSGKIIRGEVGYTKNARVWFKKNVVTFQNSSDGLHDSWFAVRVPVRRKSLLTEIKKNQERLFEVQGISAWLNVN